MDPSTAKDIAKGTRFRQSGEDDEAIDFFSMHLPRLKAKHPEIKVYDFVQQPGECCVSRLQPLQLV